MAVTLLAGGAVSGVLFGERTIPESERALVSRASRIVVNLMEWLPEEQPPADIVYNGIGGMLEVLDPHSSFLDPRTYEKMRERQEGSFFGVGIIISRRAGKVTVIAPIAGTPAAAKGLRAGDVISAVNGEATEELSLDEVVDRVRGPEGSTVSLTIDRPALKEPLTVEIARARIPTNSVRFAFMLEPKVGYLRLSEFSNTSVREVKEALEHLSEAGMESLIFDLRDNPGGPLDAAVGVSDTFLREGQLIVSTRGRTADSVSTINAPGHGFSFRGPLVLLVNGGTASASEIVAGAVQDHDRGLLVGDVSFGKGLVQTVFTVRDTGLALTTAHYYTPSGRCIQRDFGSFIDYITHRNGTTAASSAKEQTFTTDSGRTVLGGGGVSPDVVVEARELSDEMARLYVEAAFFHFAVELLKQVPDEQQEEFARRFEATPDVLDRFFAFQAENHTLTPEQITAVKGQPESMTDLSRALRVEVLNATLGLEEGYRAGLEGDTQLKAARERLDEAAEFWRAWNKT